jgi:hypothetical protein
MGLDASAIALSGLRAAGTRLGASAHNVANLTTPGFRPLGVRQLSQPGGGTRAVVVRLPGPVDLAHEAVERLRAGYAFRASLRVLGADAALKGTLADLRV